MAIDIREHAPQRSRGRGELATALERELRGDVRADAYTRHLYASDASMYAREPLLVAFPRDAGDVAAAIAIAGRFDVPVVSRGGGTSLAGQTVGGRGIVLDTSRHMDAIGEIDTEARRVSRSGREIPLTPREYTLLEALARNEGRVLSRETIQERVWNDDESYSNTIAVRIRQLRQKVDDGHAVRLIHTVYGQGYVLRAPESEIEI